MDVSHYFSSEVSTSSRATQIEVRLRGHRFTVTTDRGVFSTGHLDPGTSVLLQLVPDPPNSGVAVDVGCGWGPLTLALADASPGARIIGVDTNPRAVELTRANALAHRMANIEVHLVDDLLESEPDLEIDVIWSNPPIRIGKNALHEVMSTWLPRLKSNGVAYLVANKNLGADSLHKWIEATFKMDVERIGSRQGFRVLKVTHRRS